MTKTDLRDDARLAAIRSVGWPRSGWNGGRDGVGIGGRLRWNPHIDGAEEEAPAVISVNMTVAAMAVNEMLARLYLTRNRPNRSFATLRINLAEMEIDAEPEGDQCPLFGPAAGIGDIEPRLSLPELSA